MVGAILQIRDKCGLDGLKALSNNIGNRLVKGSRSLQNADPIKQLLFLVLALVATTYLVHRLITLYKTKHRTILRSRSPDPEKPGASIRQRAPERPPGSACTMQYE